MILTCTKNQSSLIFHDCTSFTLIFIGIGAAAVAASTYFFSKKTEKKDKATKSSAKLSATPATAWPAGKPLFTELHEYPAWDDNDKSGSFMKICDMLVAEVQKRLQKLFLTL